MTTLPDRPHTTLLIIDMQEAVIEEAHGREAVVVVWVQHHDANIAKGSPVGAETDACIRSTLHGAR